MVLLASVKSPASPSEGSGSCSGERAVSSRVLRRKCLKWRSSGAVAVTEEVISY